MCDDNGYALSDSTRSTIYSDIQSAVSDVIRLAVSDDTILRCLMTFSALSVS